MKCVVCRSGETRRETATVRIERERAVLTVSDLPARICERCGEEYLDDDGVVRFQTLIDSHHRAERGP